MYGIIGWFYRSTQCAVTKFINKAFKIIKTIKISFNIIFKASSAWQGFVVGFMFPCF